MKKLYKLINNVSLKNKLIILFLVVSLIPIFIIGIISYNISSNIVIEKEINEKLQLLNVSSNKITNILENKQLTGIKFQLNEDIQKALGEESKVSKSKDKKFEFEIRKLLLKYKYEYGIDSIYLFSNDGKLYSDPKNENLSLNEYKQKKWYDKSIEQRDLYLWGDVEKINDRQVIPYVRIIVKVNSSSNFVPIGVLIINLKESYIANVYKNFAKKSPSNFYVVNERDIIISSHKQKKHLGKNFKNLFDLSSNKTNGKKGYFEKCINNEKYIFIYNSSQQTGWKFFSVVPVEEIMSATKNIKRITFLLSLFCILICLLISLFLSQNVTAPIKKLINMMQKAEKGNFNVKFNVRKNDEIGKLASSFNRMLVRLKKLMRKTIAVEKEKREAELKVLGFQINPHFLYNTLSSIIWLSSANKKNDVIKLTKSLSEFFRISISKGKEIIRIENEIDHIKSYLEIQKIRYSDEFDVVYEVNKDIFAYFVPKLILQPLVENAIYHGIKNLHETKGLIKITGYKSNDKIILKVEDNGEALSESEINYMNKFLNGEISTEDDFGIGITNVNDRIKLYFGDEYGLKFKSQNQHTVAEITIPAAKEEDMDV